MLTQAAALGAFVLARGMPGWIAAAVLLRAGTAAVYPTLIAQVSDLVPAGDRATALGVHRLWRDLGYVAGALLGGVLADALGIGSAILATAMLTVGSGIAAGWCLRDVPLAHAPLSSR